jgi:RNA polymerase sigma-70 factor (ECF subfamily)
MAMGSSVGGRTSASLLGRLRANAADQAAWSEFVRRYGRQIYRWCRKYGLQPADAEDVTQTVLMKLAEKLRAFTYDPARSFRAYLKTLTHYAWCDFLDAQKRPGAGSGDSGIRDLLQTVEARDDLVEHLREEFDLEIMEAAMARVSERVEPHTWEAFRLTAVEELPGGQSRGAAGNEGVRRVPGPVRRSADVAGGDRQTGGALGLP